MFCDLYEGKCVIGWRKELEGEFVIYHDQLKKVTR